MLGFSLVLLAAFFFCFQNVIVRVLFNPHTVLGLFQTGGFVTPTLPNSFLLLCLRMLLVAPLMAVVANRLYPSTWKDVQTLGRPEQRPWLLRSLLGGVWMFLYLALLYVAVGLIPTGIAMTLFFTYPVFTALLSWRIFGSRPSLFRWSVMALVLFGSTLTIPQQPVAGYAHLGYAHAGHAQPWLGVLLAITSGFAYALYAVNAQKSFEQVNPIPFTWISFATTLLLSAISLLFWHGPPTSLDWTGLWLGSLLSALFTLTGHLLNNLGIRLIGATSAAMIGASNPALTVVLAWFTIQERLQTVQLVGVAIVTLSVAMLSREHRGPQPDRKS